MIQSKIIAIESNGEKSTLVLEEKELSSKSWDNVINKGESVEDQTDLVNRKFTPFFQNGIGEHLIGYTFYKNDATEKYFKNTK